MVCFVTSHGGAFEFLKFPEEVFDQMPPFIYLRINGQRVETLRTLGDDDLSSTPVHLFHDPVDVKCLVSKQCTEFDVLDQRRNTNSNGGDWQILAEYTEIESDKRNNTSSPMS